MNSLAKSLLALSIAGLLVAGCGKKEEAAIAPAVVEQSDQPTNAAAEQAKSEAELAIEEAKKASAAQ